MDMKHVSSVIEEFVREADKLPPQQVRGLIESGRRRLGLVTDTDEREAMVRAIARLEESLAKREGGDNGSFHRNSN